MAKRQDGRAVGRVFFRNGVRRKVVKRGDGRLVAMPSASTTRGRRISGKTVHHFVHYRSIPSSVLENVRAWRRAGFQQVIWSFNKFPCMKGVRVRNAARAMSRHRFTALRRRGVGLALIKDEVSLYALREEGGWWADMDVWPLKHAPDWERYCEGKPTVLSTHPLRQAGLPMSPAEADWERNGQRGRFSLALMYVDATMEKGHQFASLAYSAVKACNTAYKPPRQPTDACGKWKGWQANTAAVLQQARELELPLVAPIHFCPTGNFFRASPDARKPRLVAGCSIPSWQRINAESFSLNLWSDRWSSTLQDAVRASANLI
ncbi:unnamed protein product [Symbiodinium sp. CCMP2592]|nr:unnamed protein product [Symbiodinium sp. CCMP2592]